MDFSKEDAAVVLVLLKRVNNIAFEETEPVAILRQKLMKMVGPVEEPLSQEKEKPAKTKE